MIVSLPSDAQSHEKTQFFTGISWNDCRYVANVNADVLQRLTLFRILDRVAVSGTW